MKKLCAAIAVAAVVAPVDAKANVQKLTKATEDAGYPSSVKR